MFQVEWVEGALADLAAIWMHADREMRAEVTAASNLIDRQLRECPFEQGESREDNCRIHFVDPLAITFEVEEGPQRVWVLKVWATRRPGN